MIVKRRVVFPEHTNPHGSAFGGDIMRWVIEGAREQVQADAALKTDEPLKNPLRLMKVDNLAFSKPIYPGEVITVEAEETEFFMGGMFCSSTALLVDRQGVKHTGNDKIEVAATFNGNFRAFSDNAMLKAARDSSLAPALQSTPRTRPEYVIQPSARFGPSDYKGKGLFVDESKVLSAADMGVSYHASKLVQLGEAGFLVTKGVDGRFHSGALTSEAIEVRTEIVSSTETSLEVLAFVNALPVGFKGDEALRLPARCAAEITFEMVMIRQNAEGNFASTKLPQHIQNIENWRRVSGRNLHQLLNSTRERTRI